jgi:hypothetical protein
MISADQLEILLRSVPQYFLFGGLTLYIFGWINKKQLYLTIAEVLFIVLGLAAFIVLSGKMIPSPLEQGIVKEHIEMVIKILVFLSINGLLALISLGIRQLRKKTREPLPLVIFAFSMYIFFISTSMSKVKFELNHPAADKKDSLTSIQE